MLITYQATLLSRRSLTDDVYHVSFSWPTDGTWTFQAGQYMIFHIPQSDGHPARRLYSIASPPSQKGSLDFVIELIPDGIGSTYIHTLPIGQQTTIQGPAGVFTFKSPPERTPIFLATGTGIAPNYSIIHELLTSGYTQPVYLYWGLKTNHDLYLHTELDALAKQYPNFTHKVCLSREAELESVSCFMKGHINDGYEAMLEEKKAQRGNFDYYLCGSKHVVESLRTYLTEKGVPASQVFFEKFTT
jgi:ferredoxin-NADP reductase